MNQPRNASELCTEERRGTERERKGLQAGNRKEDSRNEMLAREVP